MNCPKCYEPLRIAERQGVEIDYCPDCRGLWLDRGELDKIIERTMSNQAPPPPPSDPYSRSDRSWGKPEKHHYDKDYHKKKKYKKKNILKEILDILD